MVILGLLCIIMCTFLSALTTVPSGYSDFRREWLSNHGKGKFSFF